jgi:hypothetical protein
VRVGTPESAKAPTPAPAPARAPAEPDEEKPAARPAEPARTAQRARAPEKPPAEARAPDDLPELSVLRLRWHPDARRRSVSLTYDAREIEDAREGDMIEDLEIEEILPDAIVVRSGDALHRVALRP